MNKIFKLLLITIVVVILILAGFNLYSSKASKKVNKTTNSSSLSNSTEWKLYENQKFRFSFRHPPNFKFISENDYSEFEGNLNPGYLVRFIGSDKKTLLTFNISLDANPLRKTPKEQMDSFFDYVSTRKPEPYDPAGEPFAERIIFNGVPYIKSGIVSGDYYFITYTDKKSYQISLIKPPIYDKSSEPIGYNEGVLSDVDFNKIMESFTFK